MSHAAGHDLLHYSLTEKIGDGGMGAVWRAQDTSLDRDVAIKILSTELATDREMLARFEREAKILASLSHPNLASVFGVHEADGTPFIAMELVSGEDLSRVLARGPLPIDDSLRIAIEVASALEAAHAQGVVHRDLKPANIRLGADGHVKVLDFGLAKAVDPGSRGEDGAGMGLTSTGVILGTAPYMSPEQARGEAVDARSDIWAFGCVVWECLTGQRPFPARTVPEQIVVIQTQEPDWTLLPAATPPGLVRLLRRCLNKSPRQRLHHIADARIELEDLRAGEAAGPPSSPRAAAAPRRRPALAVAVAAVAGGAVAAVAMLWAGSGNPHPAGTPRARGPILSSFTQLTNYEGEELDAAISPDGEFVAFLGDRSGTFELYAGTLKHGGFEVVGRGNPKSRIYAPMVVVRKFGFLNDEPGLWLGGLDGRPLRRMPLVGGSLVPWLPAGMIHVDWTRDGKRIVYSHSAGGDPVYVADADDPVSEKPILGSFDGFHQHFPTWSTDEQWIYVVRGRVSSGVMDLFRVRPDGSGLQQLTRDLRNVSYPVSVDDRTVLFLAQEQDGSGPWVWQLDVESGEPPERATIGPMRFTSLSANRDRTRFVASISKPEATLNVFPIREEGVADEKDVEPYELNTVRALAPRIRAGSVYYLSSRGGGDGIWCLREGDGKPREIWSPKDGPVLDPPAVSPDGTRLAIVIRHPTPRLVVTDEEGTLQQRLLEDRGIDLLGAPCWSPDGAWIAIGGVQAGKPGLFKIRVADGVPERLLTAEAMNPVWDPKNRMIVFQGAHRGAWQPLLAVTPEGQPVPGFPRLLVRPFGERARFLPDGTGLVCVMGLDPEQEFHLLDLESMTSRPLTNLASSARMRTFDVSADGRSVVFDRRRGNTDVYLIEPASR
jgi:Tol biopolymer transport system component